jgi:hypothetical protein
MGELCAFFAPLLLEGQERSACRGCSTCLCFQASPKFEWLVLEFDHDVLSETPAFLARHAPYL